ncbi:metallophosphoesterase [Lysobacter sp. KIS68-7]|nr:metallophosphoesterase [Lysobacter sp. KIS68-7]UHQ19025.1 metallophosphoesterase [Lysobacter sp. KIS68-7]
MLLLHVSDIHFRSPDCLDSNLDPERPYRTRLLQDVRARVAELGPVGAILVGGDIAFKGAADEYQVAMTWLRELAAVAGCPIERVFVVPGNHDVDRAIAQRPATRNVRAAISQAGAERRDRELRAQIMDSDTGRALLAPIGAYNEFAKDLNCQVYFPERLYWKQDLELDHGVTLRVHGLTSSLLSGTDGNDTRESLYLSPLQTVLDPVDDVVNLVLCHHPPDWLMDQDDANDAICGRASIHMFGHKHRQRIQRDPQYIRFSAGAVNPDRQEPGWLPGYNLVDVRVAGEGKDRVLRIEAHLRQWQSNPDQFRAVLDAGGEDVFRHEIRIPSSTLSGVSVVDDAGIGGSESLYQPADSADADSEAAMGDPITRNLVFRFWKLQSSQRREIALGLDLITEDEMRVPEPERYGRALIRASERGKLDELARQVAQKESQ